jgi:hypothetical protein
MKLRLIQINLITVTSLHHELMQAGLEEYQIPSALRISAPKYVFADQVLVGKWAPNLSNNTF